MCKAKLLPADIVGHCHYDSIHAATLSLTCYVSVPREAPFEEKAMIGVCCTQLLLLPAFDAAILGQNPAKLDNYTVALPCITEVNTVLTHLSA